MDQSTQTDWIAQARSWASRAVVPAFRLRINSLSLQGEVETECAPPSGEREARKGIADSADLLQAVQFGLGPSDQEFPLEQEAMSFGLSGIPLLVAQQTACLAAVPRLGSVDIECAAFHFWPEERLLPGKTLLCTASLEARNTSVPDLAFTVSGKAFFHGDGETIVVGSFEAIVRKAAST